MRVSIYILPIVIITYGKPSAGHAGLLPGTAAKAHAEMTWADGLSGLSKNNQQPCSRVSITSTEFGAVLGAMQGRSFEASRLSMVRDFIRGQCLTSAQVRQLLELFTFEQTRLDLAKFAYSHIVDKPNFHVVYLAFQFTASVAELEAFVRMQP